jgi:type I restriction enzyme, S subunit
LSMDLVPFLIRSIFLELFGDVATNSKGWTMKTIGEVCETQLGKAISKKAKLCKSPSKYLRNANVKWRHIDLDDLKEMDFEEREKDKLRLKNGDVLVTEGGNVGRSAIWTHGDTEIFYQNSLHRVRVNSDFILPEYFVEYMAVMDERDGLLRETTKVTIAHLTGTKLRRLPIPIPPIELQVSFVEMMGHINEINDINRQLVKSLVESVNGEAFK